MGFQVGSDLKDLVQITVDMPRYVCEGEGTEMVEVEL
jgi:hypothetical protein